MPRSRRMCAVLATAVLGASPGAAWAQSAGDDQYEDPFGDETPQTQAPAPSATPALAPSGAAPVPGAAQAEGTSAGNSAAAVAAPVRGRLPRTGSGTGWLALAGPGLLAAGIALRLWLRDGARSG